ncbi:ribose 5-phosphate isomerase B [Bacteroidia bacterium]|nr:ribose 5-phosphate isomerase B [Bacteroidia bacterium]
MTIGFANDHTGVALKRLLMQHCQSKGYACLNFGADSTQSVDYPDFAHALATAVLTHKVDIGFAFCGTGNGVAITLNKHPHIRAGLCWNATVAQLIKQHNNANVCVIPARFVTEQQAVAIADAYLDTVFEGGRHQTRIDKIDIGIK